jgi:tetratricopeptide (TPR) repeat protein
MRPRADSQDHVVAIKIEDNDDDIDANSVCGPHVVAYNHHNRVTDTRKQRGRSEDFVDEGVIVTSKTSGLVTSRRNNPKLPPLQHVSNLSSAATVSGDAHQTLAVEQPDVLNRCVIGPPALLHKSRCRSEDYVDGPVYHVGSASSDELVSSNESSSMGSPSVFTIDHSTDCSLVESPTSVTHFELLKSKDPTLTTTTTSKKLASKRQSPTTNLELEESLLRWRNSIATIKRRSRIDGANRQDSAMLLCKTYYHMGLIHYQLCRYTTAMHVLEHGLEVLIQAFPCTPRSSNQEYHRDDDNLMDSTPNPWHLPLLNESMPYLSSEAMLLVGTIFTLQAKIDLAQGMWEFARSRAEQVMIAFDHEHVRRRIGSPRPFGYFVRQIVDMPLDVATEWSLTMARAQIVLGQLYQQDQRPDLAMRCYQDALTVQRYGLGDHHVQVAETLHRIGDLHTSQSMLGPATVCYQEALRVYQLPGNAAIADVATILSSLGWVALLQHNFSAAFYMSQQALELTMQCHGPQHRNIASIRYQLGWMTWWSNASVPVRLPQTPRDVLSQWKLVLKHQEQVLFPKQPSSQTHSDDCHSTSQPNHHRRRHVDLAKTLHAMGYAYHALSRKDKAHTVLQAADAIYQENISASRRCSG